MRKLYLFTIFFLLTIISKAQCPPEGELVLESQEDVDNFVAQYPDCTEINGDLFIGTFSPMGLMEPMDLTGLSSLTSVTGSINIYRLDYFENGTQIPGNLLGLENISSVKNLRVGLMDPAGFPGNQPPSALESLAPLGNIAGQVDTLWVVDIMLDEELPDFNQIEAIDYFKLLNLRGIAITPALESLVEIRDFTVGNSGFVPFEEQGLQTVVIPENLSEVSLPEDWNSFPVSGIFIYGLYSLEQIIGGESLSVIASPEIPSGIISIARNSNLFDMSAFDNITEVYGEIDLESCLVVSFSSFPNLGYCETLRITNEEAESGGYPCENSNPVANIGVGVLADELIVDGKFTLRMDSISEINFSGTLKEAGAFEFGGNLAETLSSFNELDTIGFSEVFGASGRMEINLPSAEQLPGFLNLTTIEDLLIILLFDTETEAGSPLQNLEGLEALESAGGIRLTGNENTALTSLDGLENLEFVEGSIRIRNLPNLSSVEALANLRDVDEINLRGLPSLESFPVFSDLEDLRRFNIRETGLIDFPTFPVLDSLESLSIRLNPQLTSISGMDELTSLSGFTLDDNASINEVSLPLSLEFEGVLTFTENPSLSDCGESASLCNLFSQANMLVLGNNGSACNDSTSVLDACVLAIDDVFEKDFKAYFSSASELRIETDLTNDFTLRLTNTLGQEIYNRQLAGGSEQYAIPLHKTLANGYYILSYVSEGTYQSISLPYFFRL